MRTSILLIFMAAVPGLAGAQTVNGYVVTGVGSCMHRVANVSVAGGGDGFLYRGLTAGGEIGYYRFVERGGGGFGIADVNAGYRRRGRREERFEPFFNGGLALAFRSGASLGVSFGGGVDYWFSRRVGLRFEGRGYGFAGEAMAKFRMGISFR